MNTVRILLILGGLFLGAGTALAEPDLLLNWDRGAASSTAVVKNGDGDVLAETQWEGALPRAFSPDQEITEVPTFVLGQLRDQLEQSSQPEADEALDFVLILMDVDADIPLAELIKEDQTWIPSSAVHVDEWCGTEITVNSECTQPGEFAAQTTLCGGSVCKGTKLEPAQ